MMQYIVKRILLAAFTLALVSFLSFIIIQLPAGDYVDYYARHSQAEWGRAISLEEQAELREEFGLNQPMVLQWWDWVSPMIFRADFGVSFRPADQKTPVRKIIADRLPVTILFTAFTTVFIFVFSIPIGIYSAVRQHSIGDYTFTFLGFTGLAVPDFLLGLVLMYLFLAHFGVSVGGLFSGEYQFAPWSVGKVLDLLQHMIIPAIVLGTAGLAGGIRTMRNNLLDELYKPYVVAARAKGMVSWKLIAKYPVRVAINPFVSGIGSMLPGLVGGSVIVSIILSLPTLGPIMLIALQSEDQFLSGTIIGVLISDLLLVVVDPRIKLSGSGR